MVDNINSQTEDMKSSNNLKQLAIAAIIILAVVVSGIYLYSITAFKKPLPITPPIPSVPPQPVVVKQAAVRISATGFMPATIEVQKGMTVTWTNLDKKSHQVASNPHPTHTLLPELVSDPLLTNDTFTFTFNKTGTFTYHDHLNPLKFQGTVIVK